MKPTVRPSMGHYDWRGKFDGDKKSYKHRGRQRSKKEIEKELEMVDEKDLVNSECP